MPGLNRRPKTETVTFRLDAKIRSALDGEVDESGGNLNNLVSQILKEHVTWGRYATKLRLFPISKDILRAIFQVIPGESIERIGRTLGQTVAQEEILFLFKRKDRGTVVQFLKLWTDHFDAREQYYDQERYFFTIHHDVNLNFSIFLREYIGSMLQSLVGRTPHIEGISPNSLSFSFEAAPTDL